jgi:hypothetical protein
MYSPENGHTCAKHAPTFSGQAGVTVVICNILYTVVGLYCRIIMQYICRRITITPVTNAINISTNNNAQYNKFGKMQG